MSKAVKNLLINDLSRKLDGVSDCVLVNVIGIDANNTCALRKRLREKNISMTVVRNGLVKRAAEGTPLAPAFEQMEGSLAVCWGGEDFIDLAPYSNNQWNSAFGRVTTDPVDGGFVDVWTDSGSFYTYGSVVGNDSFNDPTTILP